MDRPFPRHPRPESNWLQLDAEVEVRMAISQGLDGFIYECKQSISSDVRWNRLPSMRKRKGGEIMVGREGDGEENRRGV